MASPGAVLADGPPGSEFALPADVIALVGAHLGQRQIAQLRLVNRVCRAGAALRLESLVREADFPDRTTAEAAKRVLPSLQRLHLRRSTSLEACFAFSHLRELRCGAALEAMRACYANTHTKPTAACRLGTLDGFSEDPATALPAGLFLHGGLPRLESLFVGRGWCLTDAAGSHVSALTRLTSLAVLHARDVSGATLGALCAVKALRALHLRGWPFGVTGWLPAGNSTSALPQLSRLALHACGQLSDGMLARLTALRALRDLSLPACYRITQLGLAELSTLTQLTALNLSCTRATDSCVEALARLPRLRHLQLACCWEVSEAARDCFAGRSGFCLGLQYTTV